MPSTTCGTGYQPVRTQADSLCHSAILLVALSIAGSSLAAATERPEYPPTRTDNVVDTVQGVKIPDPYRWLEDSNYPAVQEWTAQQNALTRRLLDQFPRERDKLTKRLDELHSANVSSPPAQYGDRYFFTKRTGLENHPVVYVREGSLEAEPRVAINPNTFSKDGTVALDWWFPSPDGGLIAYGKSEAGNEKSTLYIRDVRAEKDLDEQIPNTRAAAIAWDLDSRGFTYTRYPEPGSVPAGDENYYRHVYYHKLGTAWKDDPKIWGEGQPKEYWPNVNNSGDNRYQFLSVSIGWSKNDLYVRKTGQKDFQTVAEGFDALFSGDVLADKLFIRTNHEAPRYRIVVTDVNRPQSRNWDALIDQQDGVINEFAIVGGKLVLGMMENVHSRLLIYEPDGKLATEIELPTLGTANGLSGRPDRNDLFFTFQSFAYPPAVYDYDVRANTSKVIDRMPVDIDARDYETKQVWCTSKDGTRVPMFVTYRRNLRLNGDNPCVLYGYGGFNGSQLPQFYRGGIPWLDAGGIWAVSNARGGGEFGEDWHRAGQLDKKQNTFDDFIAAAEKLIADGYTKREKLGCRGGSNGGLTVGAMIVQRPDLFQAVDCAVPLLDMLRYQNFKIARLWIPEYGTAEDPNQFKFLHAYSPYQHVKKGTAYPAVLLTTAESDSRVDPMHARKMAAALQADTSSDRPILLWVETKAGHGAGKPLTKYIEDQVDVWTFFSWQLGVWQK